VESAGGVRLFDACMRDLSPAGPRDAVILALGLAAGLRRAEIAGLSLADLDGGRSGARRGEGPKGSRSAGERRHAGGDPGVASVSGRRAGAVVGPVRKGGRVELRALAPAAVVRICEKRGEEAGLREFSPHDLRRA